ncbi:hypothetical protein B0H17DRAFT_1126196 [Mycena rosella]|uniref:Peptidase A2 domain-containing protein n=1 Tax=Mycena rosella TaxID=1033263 RepID=A0AAD7M881_MYCRO|nr:hypothetical protein B0H17DRAFT_1126196 [Mycena rosella]
MEAREKTRKYKPPEGNEPVNQENRKNKEKRDQEKSSARPELPYRFVKPLGAGARTLPAHADDTERRRSEDSGKAYKLKAPIQRDGLTEEMLERINSTEVTVKLGDLFGISKDLREGEKLRLTRVRQLLKDRELALPNEVLNMEQQVVAEPTLQDCQLLGDALDLGDLPEVQGVFVTTVAAEGIPAGSLVAQDPYLQYLEGLSEDEGPKQIYVARDSVPLRVTFPYVNSQGPVECVLDTGSQIVSMSLEEAQKCGLVWDPTINIFMQSANGQLEKSMGLAKNVPFRWGELRIYLQVHVIRSPAYKVLLGRPFDVLTKSRTDHEEGRQLLTLTDPNSGRAWTVPTYDRPKQESGKKGLPEQMKNDQGADEDFRIASRN